mmetsp:Transcript_2662/g.5504  ORF Transcript_2662/g.5504 Transcript_2662/m.5504 type:complete len:104 (-) Transcript_2662:127-438(-)
MSSLEYNSTAPLEADSTIFADVPRQNAYTPPPSRYTLRNAVKVLSWVKRPIRVFQTSNGMPRVAASTHCRTAPFTRSLQSPGFPCGAILERTQLQNQCRCQVT